MSAGGTGSCPPDERRSAAVRASHPAAAYRKRQAEPARPPLCGVTAAEGGFFMDSHPFSAAYWHMAAGELKNVRKLTFAALCMALCMALSAIPSVPLWGGAKITWGFLARAVCAWVCGPVLGLVFGAAEDLLSFFITGGGGYPFFPGYTLTTMLGVFLYALFFYKSKITLRNVFLAKLLTNLENVLLGALWMAILSGKAWYITASGSVIKNLVCLPFQTVLLLLLMTALRPALKKMRLVE